MTARLPKGKSSATRTTRMVRAIEADLRTACDGLKQAARKYEEGDAQGGAEAMDQTWSFVLGHPLRLWKEKFREPRPAPKHLARTAAAQIFDPGRSIERVHSKPRL